MVSSSVKSVEELLGQSGQFIIETLNNFQDGIFALNHEGVFLYLNKRAASHFGVEPKELVGKNIWEWLPKENAGMVRKYNEIKANQQVANFIWENKASKSWFSVTVYPSSEGLIVHWRDVSQHKKAKAALEESEERFAKAFYNNPTAMAISKMDGQLVDINDSFLAVVGYTRSEIIGKTGIELGLYGDKSEREKILKQLELKGAVSNYETLFVGKSGRQIITLLSVTPITLHGERHLLGSAVDITERKKTEQALSLAKTQIQEYATNLEKLVEERSQQIKIESERFFKISENLPIMVCLITTDYKIPYANRLFREKFGEAKGRCCYEYIGCVKAPCKGCESQVPLRTGKPHHWTATFPDGTVIDAYDFPFTDVDGTKMILEADIDITDRIHLQKQLRDKERLAAIGMTAGMVGHDIRNPLQAMISDIYLIKEEIAFTPECKIKDSVIESLERLDENISYINKIVQDLQDYARPISAEYSDADLSHIVTKIFENINLPDSIKLSIKLKDLERLKTDNMLLQRALSNLVTNAVQAMPKGGLLEISGHPEKNKAIITIADTGVGIPSEIKPKLFTPMITTKSKGQGFGLAVSKRLIEALGGTITFESEEGKGTKFTIELPG